MEAYPFSSNPLVVSARNNPSNGTCVAHMKKVLESTGCEWVDHGQELGDDACAVTLTAGRAREAEE